MTVVDLVRQYLKVRVDISGDQLWNEIQIIAQQLNIDLNSIDEAYAQLIAEEIDKNAGSLAVSEGSGAITKGGRKQEKDTPQTTGSSQAEILRTALTGLKQVIQSEVDGVSTAFDSEFSKNERRVAKEIAARAKQTAPNIITYVAEELEAYKADSRAFLGEIEGIVQDVFSS